MSLLTDLFSTLDKRSLGGVASALGESDQTVSKGMHSAIATVLGGMASKSDNPNLLRKVLDLAPSGTGDALWSNLASGVSDPNSPVISTGKRMLSTLFGGSESAITRAFSAGTSLQPGVTSSLLAVAAPIVMGFLGKKVRDEGMNMGGLGNTLQREIPALRSELPAGVSDLLWPREYETATASPVVAQAVTREKSSLGWVVPLVLLALIPGLIWLFSHGSKPVAQAPATVTGTANRYMPAPDVREIPKPVLPKNVDLYFETGSAKLKPESYARLDEFTAALKTDGDAHINVNGYTDNVGAAAGNMRLSEERANAVKADLVRRGISADRLTTQGFGEDDPIADNATAAGRGLNRRVSVGVTDRP